MAINIPRGWEAVVLFFSGGRLSLLVTMASKFGIAVMGGVSAAVVATVSGQKALGYFALVRIVPAIFVLLTEFGISNSYPFMIKRAANDAKCVYRSGVFCILIIFVIQICAWGMASPALNRIFFEDFTVGTVVIIGAIAPLQVIHLHATNLLRAVDRVRDANAILFLNEFLLAIFLTYLAIVSRMSNETILASVIFASLIVAIGSVVWLWRAGYKFIPSYNKSILKNSVRYGVKSQVGNAFQVLNYRLDQLLIGGFIGAADLGLYAVASKAAELFKVFSKSIVFVLEPLLAGTEVSESRRVVERNYINVFSINFGFMLFGVFIVPLVIPFFFGDWSESSILPFYILALGVVVGGGNGLIGAYNFSIGEPELNTKVIAIGLATAIISNIGLVPLFGVMGAAWASVITQCVVTVSFGIQFLRRPKYPS